MGLSRVIGVVIWNQGALFAIIPPGLPSKRGDFGDSSPGLRRETNRRFEKACVRKGFTGGTPTATTPAGGWVFACGNAWY